jgi:hypothetical protein
MSSSATISLFSERPLSNQRPTSYIISLVAHGTGVLVVSSGLLLQPQIIVPPRTERLAVRHLELEMPPPEPSRSSDDSKLYPEPKKPASSDDPSPAARPAVARQVAQLTPTKQTLLQPKLKPQVLPEKTPVPTVVLWSMEIAQPKLIVPPLPQKILSAKVQPAIDPPNDEPNLADIDMSSAESPVSQPILPSTTSPLVVLAKDPAQAAPQTTSTSTAQPTPATIVSLSDLRAQGTVVLPPANQTASASTSGLIASGSPEDVGKADGNSAGQGAALNGKTSASGAAKGAGANAGADPPASGVGSGNFGSVAKYVLPKDGQFGVVVVGNSLEETYPEAAELWSGRLAYTVYLHVGLRKSWILQYALPADAVVSSGGNAAKIAAPWPYTIVRPNLAPGAINADAIMIHGFIDTAGRFASLAVAFPAQFQQAAFVLNSLRQWQFRPASQAGQPTIVEVLLIIPDEEDD